VRTGQTVRDGCSDLVARCSDGIEISDHRLGVRYGGRLKSSNSQVALQPADRVGRHIGVERTVPGSPASIVGRQCILSAASGRDSRKSMQIAGWSVCGST
jgi:hypothetical protein